MSSGPILVSGFESFGLRRQPNPSSDIVLPAIKEKFGNTVETLILPVAFEQAHANLLTEIETIDPAAIVMFGVTNIPGRRRVITVEEVARNRSVALLQPDNLGQRRFGRIVPGASSKLHSTLPNDEIVKQLHNTGVPAKLSTDAAAYVCNELLFRTLYEIEESRRAVTAGFIHIGSGLERSLVERAAVNVISSVADSLSS